MHQCVCPSRVPLSTEVAGHHFLPVRLCGNFSKSGRLFVGWGCLYLPKCLLIVLVSGPIHWDEESTGMFTKWPREHSKKRIHLSHLSTYMRALTLTPLTKIRSSSQPQVGSLCQNLTCNHIYWMGMNNPDKKPHVSRQKIHVFLSC